MVFSDVLGRWYAQGRYSDVAAINGFLDDWQRLGGGHRQFLANMDRDSQLSYRHREGLLEALLKAGPKVLDQEKAVLGYCRAHQQEGEEVPSSSRITFGHVMTFKKLEGILASSRRGSNRSPFTLGNIAVSMGTQDFLKQDLKQQKSILKSILLSSYQMWSFYQKQFPDNPYFLVSTDSANLRRRLGLGHYKPDETLVFTAHKPDVRVCMPTTFDGELSPYYRPGGKSCPLNGSDGLDETIHDPISGRHLSVKIEIAP